MTPRPRHLLLREATAVAHDRLDRGVEAAGYFGSLPRYGQYLQRLLQFYRHLEAVLPDDAAPIAHRFDISRRAPWLAADLKSLGLQPLLATGSQHWRAVGAVCPSSLLGSLYVLCGATLGARLLVRQAEALGIADGAGTTYLTELARSAHWPQFLHHLEAAAVPSVERMIGGAIAAFESFQDHLLEPIPA